MNFYNLVLLYDPDIIDRKTSLLLNLLVGVYFHKSVLDSFGSLSSVMN